MAEQIANERPRLLPLPVSTLLEPFPLPEFRQDAFHPPSHVYYPMRPAICLCCSLCHWRLLSAHRTSSPADHHSLCPTFVSLLYRRVFCTTFSRELKHVGSHQAIAHTHRIGRQHHRLRPLPRVQCLLSCRSRGHLRVREKSVLISFSSSSSHHC